MSMVSKTMRGNRLRSTAKEHEANATLEEFKALCEEFPEDDVLSELRTLSLGCTTWPQLHKKINAR